MRRMSVVGWLAKILLLLSSVASGAEIVGPSKVEPYRMARFSAKGGEKSSFSWAVSPRGKTDSISCKDVDFAFVGPPGVYEVELLEIGPTGDPAKPFSLERTYHTVTIGIAPPTPDPDIDPDVDPEPTPTPDNAPFPANGLHVLVVYETGENLPPKQQQIIFGTQSRDYLRQACKSEPQGSWRIYDQNLDVSAESATWQAAMGVKRDAVPWVVISNGKTGFSGPLPENVEKFIDLVQKYEVK